MAQILKTLILVLMLSTWTSAQVFSEEPRTEEEIKRLALEAILENPEIIRQAAALLERMDDERQRNLVGQTLSSRWAELADSPDAPVLGNVDGDVTLVEFFDYNCPYCRRAKPEISALIEADPNVRLVYREWPILGEGSVFAARAALASRSQGLYEKFHWALMGLRTRANEASVLQIAEQIGLDTEQLAVDMNSPDIDAHIALSMDLAQNLNITGTPTFVLIDKVMPGLVESDQLIAEVERIRSSEAK